jgi:hypothetical protein
MNSMFPTLIQRGIGPSAVIAFIVAIGCSNGARPAKKASSANKKPTASSQGEHSDDPVTSFEAVIASIEKQISAPREYLKRHVGTYNQPPNFVGDPADAGKPFERYERVFREWRVKGHDIKKTDSLVSPYEAILVLESREQSVSGGKSRLQKPEDVLGKPFTWDGGWGDVRCSYKWRNGKWVPSKDEWPFNPSKVPDEEKSADESKVKGFSFKRLK